MKTVADVLDEIKKRFPTVYKKHIERHGETLCDDLFYRVALLLFIEKDNTSELYKETYKFLHNIMDGVKNDM